MPLNTVSSDRLSTNVKNTNFTAAEKQDLTDDIKPLLGSSGGGNKNLIINGAMQVAQRGTSSTSSGIFTVDRFSNIYSGTDEVPTQAQVDVASGSTPYTLGFRKAFRITNGNQTSGAGAGDFIFIRYRAESQDISNSGWNYTSSSSFITLSFWVKSSVAQNFFGYLEAPNAPGGGDQYPFETGSLSADTWTKITKTIPGNSNLVINNNNLVGLTLALVPFFGTDYTNNSASVNTWKTYESAARMPDNTSTWYTTNDATFEITGVQLEVGNVATEFDHRSFAQELALCQRYFQRVNGSLTGIGANATSIRANYTPIVNLRASPTITGNNPVSFNDPGVASPTQSSFDCGIQFTYTPTNIGMSLGFGNFPSNGQTAQGKAYIQWDSANDYIDFAAEL